MNRRDRARQKKRKERERRLRQERHAAHAQPMEPDALDEELLDELGDDESPVTDAGDAASPTATVALSQHDEERTLRRIRRAIRRLVDATPTELETAAASLASKTLEELDAEFGDDPVERAQDLAFRAWDADDLDEMVSLLDEALRLDSSCTDAQVLLALQQRRERDRLAALDAVIEDAEARLGGHAGLPRDGTLWMDVAARPYLRARNERLNLLAGAGHTDEAIAEGNALLELDPSDHVLARNHLAGALLEAGDLAGAGALIARFSDSSPLTLGWARVLHRFLTGERREAALVRLRVSRLLPQVEELILGTRRVPRPRDPRTTPLELLAADAYVPLARAWARHKEARRWLADGALASTAADRRAAPENYRPPVAALLRLGEPVFGGPGEDLSHWPTYLHDHGLRAEHVPELLAMADDPALHEQDARNAAVWAPVHAWRALALLAAAGVRPAADVASLLLLRLPDHPEDDWTHEDAVHVLGLIGAPAFDEAAAMLANRELDQTVRGTLACALAAIASRHPDMREEAIGKLALAVREIVEEIEHAQRDEPQAPLDELIGDDDRYVAGLAVAGLMELHAGMCTAGPAMIGLVERALALGIVEERDCGTREEVLAELLGTRGSPPSPRAVAFEP